MTQERYQRLDRIAVGGMGEVWRARDTMLGREVALKVLKPEFAGDATFRTRFADEGRHAAALHHSGIATVYDVGEDAGVPFLVMELVDGQPLSALIRPGVPMAPDAVRSILGQAADAVAVAHDAGVIHRDIKPANLLVTPNGTVKVTDFGIARAVGSASLTQTGQIMGSPH
ncbi:MAG TPA: serine/threonine-protein kinase, partial [Marmoricola sp.]|nr:serine/threonine-protein kinase [Marmoricola sp.]